MSETVYKSLLIILGLSFAVIFTALCVPPLLKDFDIVAGALAGFVNPFSSGYAMDAIMCWNVLAVWVWYEAKTLQIKHGWICLVVGAVPGVATGFALYLLLRHKQLNERQISA